MSAWTTAYKKGVHSDRGTPVGYAILAFKQRLAAAGYGETMNMDTTVIGDRMDKAIRAYQRHVGLIVDGEIGPHTSAALFGPLFTELAVGSGIPDDLVCKGCKLESGVDPGAVGVVDPHDLGIMQLNAPSHPNLTVDQMFDAEFSLGLYARTLAQQHATLGDWDCAIASWNVGGGGAQWWCANGKPATGGPSWFPGLAERATQYTRLVRGQAC